NQVVAAEHTIMLCGQDHRSPEQPVGLTGARHDDLSRHEHVPLGAVQQRGVDALSDRRVHIEQLAWAAGWGAVLAEIALEPLSQTRGPGQVADGLHATSGRAADQGLNGAEVGAEILTLEPAATGS